MDNAKPIPGFLLKTQPTARYSYTCEGSLLITQGDQTIELRPADIERLRNFTHLFDREAA